MRTLPSFLIILIFFFSLTGNAQAIPTLTKKDSMVVSSWIVGVGFNVVDDAGSEFENVFNISDNWNIVPHPSRLSVGRYFKGGFGLEAISTYNKYQEGKIIDGVVNAEEIDYYAVDFRASYDLNQILGQTGFFDPYVGIGAGYTEANNEGRGTYNAVVGFRTWITDNWGLDFNSSGKWAMKIEDGVTNHIQHAASVVYQFGIKKELTKKGEEKLALIQQMEVEQQRIQDSIADVKRAEEEARRLAEELECQREAERLAVEEKAKKETEEARRKALQEQVNSLGNVHFALNSSYLGSEEKQLLDQLVEILKGNPDVVIQVTSHTDSRGTDEYNQWLSERRVNRTKDYLLSNGITKDRIKSQAFGEQQLTNECDDRVLCPEEKHRKNRRSEFKIVR